MTRSFGSYLSLHQVAATCSTIVGYGLPAVLLCSSSSVLAGTPSTCTALDYWQLALAKLFPSLRPDYRGSMGATISSFSSKARILFKWKGSASNSTGTSNSNFYDTALSTEPVSPRKTTCFLDTINEPPSFTEKQSNFISQSPPGSHGKQQSSHSAAKPSLSSRLFAIFQPTKAFHLPKRSSLPLVELTGQCVTPSLTQHVRGINSDEMIVRMEMRQGVEHERSFHASNPTLT